MLIVLTHFACFERDFCRKSSVSMGKNDLLKPGKLLNATEHIRKESFQYILALIFGEQRFFKRQNFHSPCRLQFLISMYIYWFFSRIMINHYLFCFLPD